MPRAGDGCDAAAAIRMLSRYSRSTKATKLGLIQGDGAGPGEDGRTVHAHAGQQRQRRRRTRVGKVGPDDMRRMTRSGLISRPEGGRPTVTPVGRWSITTSGLGISFFEMCVLAKVYGVARSMANAGNRGAADGGPAHTATIPLRTVQYFFEDWPVYPGRVCHALSRLRSRGLIPRSRPKRVTCDIARLDAMRRELSEIGRWVDDTGEEIRRVLLHGY